MTGRQQARERERQAARENRDSTIGAGQHGNNQQGQQPGAPRQNEYFVPRDGIDREVITADICRYLGNDALVRPGTYEHDDGRTTQGYFITAYRNLTSAMIQDLKADSARWDQERRASSRATAGGSTTGGTLNSSLSNGLFVRNSNSPAAQSRNADYRGSETHQNRQYYGPSMDQPYGDPMAIDSYGSAPASNLRYPGTGNQGYNGVNSGTPYGAQQPYGAQGGYPQSAGQPYANPQAYQPNPQDRYQGMSTVGQPYGGHPSAVVTEAPFVSGSNFSSATMQSTLQAPAPSGFMDYSRDSRMPSGSSASTLPVYATTSGARPGYPTGADPNAPYYQPAPPQPLDAFYGRGAYTSTTAAPQSPSNYTVSATGNQAQTGYSTVQDPQYEEPRPPSHPSVPPAVTQTQVAPSGSTTTTTARREPRGERADRERTGERESDRHATERHERRHRNRP